MPMIVPPLFWEWFNIWLIQFLKDLYHEIKMVGLRSGSNTNSPYSHSCGNHGMASQPTGIDVTLNIPTSLTMSSPAGAPHLNPGQINMQSLSTVSLQFIAAPPQANHGPHSHHNAGRNHSHGHNPNHGHTASHSLNHGHSHTSSLGLGSHSQTNNIGLSNSHNHPSKHGLGGNHSSLGLNASHSHSNSIGLNVNQSNNLGHSANNSNSISIGSSHNLSSNLGLSGSHSHGTNIGLNAGHNSSLLGGNHNHSTNLSHGGNITHASNHVISGSHGHTANQGLSIGHSHSSNLGMSGNHGHCKTFGLAGSHGHNNSVGVVGNHSHSSSHVIGTGSSHITLGLSGNQSHSTNHGLGGSHSHSCNSVSSSHVHSAHLGMSGAHSHNSLSLSDNHSHGSKSGLGGSHSHGLNTGLSGSHNNISLGHSLLQTNVNHNNNHKLNNNATISNNMSNNSQLNMSNNTSNHNQSLKLDSSRYTTPGAMSSQAQQYRLLKQACRSAECYHPSSAPTANYMPSATGGTQGSSQGSLRVQSSQAQPSAPPAPQQDLSKQSLAGLNFVPQTQAPPRQQFTNFQQFRGTQHGSRPSSHPRQQQQFIAGAASTTGQVVFPIVFQSHMGMPYQQPRSGSPAGYYPYMGHYLPPYNQPSHNPSYYGYTTNSQQLPTQNLQSNSGGRNNPNSLVGPQGSPSAPAAPTVSLPNAQPQQHIHQTMPGIRPAPVQKRSRRLAIIDPATNQDILSESYPSSSDYSGELNDSQMSQPEAHTHSIAKEFTRMVNEAANQPDVESAVKTNFVAKNVDIPVSSTNTAQPQNTISSMSSINNNILKSDLVNINDNRNMGADAAVATCETPVVSAISDSPVIVPKMTLNVKPIQKIETTVQSIVIETNKNSQINKQYKSSNPSEKVEIEKETVVGVAPSNSEPEAVTAQMQPAPVSLPSLPPQPQRTPRERHHKSEEKDRYPKVDKENVIVPTKQNGPTTSISSVDSFQQAINLTTSQNIFNQGATAKKHVTSKPVVSKEVSTAAPEPTLTPTELLSAGIEKVAREQPLVVEPVPDKKSRAFEAQAKLTQSISSVCRAQQSEPKMKDINVNSKTADPDTANGNTSEVVKPDSSKEDINKNDKSVKNTKIAKNTKNNKKTGKMANNEELLTDSELCENGNEETDKVVNVEQEGITAEEVSEVAIPEATPGTVEEVTPAVFVPKYKYSDEQWSPLNKSGKKCYDIGLLKQIKDDPLSKNKPNGITFLEACNVIRTAPMQEPMSFTSKSRPINDTMFPAFAMVGGSRSSTSREPKKDGRNMAMTGKGSIKQNPSMNSPHKPVIHVSLSLREDVKLKQVDSAWKPTRLVKDNLSEEELKTQELYKTFRGILNKLTPQKFDTLLKKVLDLQIDNQKRMEGVIDLLFEKAIEEPNFSEAYAHMCFKLGVLRVPAENNRDIGFRTLIISKCQTQFQAGKSDERVLKLEKELNETTDSNKKKELQLMINEENRKIRLRAVANVRFIGELYKLKMLTSKIMDYCMTYLIEKHEEEKLECLCKLLTTIGGQVEKEGASQLDTIFKRMREIVERKSIKISSRVKFMIQDVIDLRDRKWVVKSVVDSQPKMMDQIQKEAEQQQRHIELMNAGGNSGGGGGSRGGFSREDGGRNKRGGDNRRHNHMESPFTPRATTRINYVVDTVKLQAGSNQKSMNEIKLAPPQWKSPKPAAPQAPANNGIHSMNTFSVLANDKADLADPTSLKSNRDTIPAYSKGASIERSTFNQRGDFNTSGRSSNVGVPRLPSGTRSQSSAPTITPEAPAVSVIQEPLPDEDFKKIKSLIDLSAQKPDNENMRQVIKSYSTKYHTAIMGTILNIVIEKSVKHVTVLTSAIQHLMTTNTISSENFIGGLKEILEFGPDLFIDIPLFYEHVGRILTPLIEEKHVAIARIFEISGTIITEKQGHFLLKAIINNLNDSMGPTFVKSKWQESGLQISQWMSEEQVPKWIADNKFEFLQGGSQPIEEIAQILTPAETQSRLLQLMNADESCDCIKGWVQDKLGKASNEDWFMRALIQAICEHALYGNERREVPHFNQDRMTKYACLINDFGDIKESKEANCLFGIQHLLHRLEHPQGLTLDIFQYLFEQYLISPEGFLAWEKSEKEPEGKGVMLKALTSFFTNIEADEDSGSED